MMTRSLGRLVAGAALCAGLAFGGMGCGGGGSTPAKDAAPDVSPDSVGAGGHGGAGGGGGTGGGTGGVGGHDAAVDMPADLGADRPDAPADTHDASPETGG
jgi:hypothetical protein